MSHWPRVAAVTHTVLVTFEPVQLLSSVAMQLNLKGVDKGGG